MRALPQDGALGLTLKAEVQMGLPARGGCGRSHGTMR